MLWLLVKLLLRDILPSPSLGRPEDVVESPDELDPADHLDDEPDLLLLFLVVPRLQFGLKPVSKS